MATRKSTSKTPAAPAKTSRHTPKTATAKRKATAEKTATTPAAATTVEKSKPMPRPAAALTAKQAEARYRAIAEAAYLLAERRGFAPGGELEDWLQAEAEYSIRKEAS